MRTAPKPRISCARLIDRIVLTPNEESKKLEIDLYGDLAGILTLASKQRRAAR